MSKWGGTLLKCMCVWVQRDCWDLDWATKPQLLSKQPQRSSCGQYNLLQQPRVLTSSSLVTVGSAGTLSSPMLPTGNKPGNHFAPFSAGFLNSCWAMHHSMTEVQSGGEWMHRWHSRLNPCNFNFLHFYRLAKGRHNFFFKGMNPVAVGNGLHWSNFLFTIKKRKI